MDRGEFLKKLGGIGIGMAAAQTGLSKEYIKQNVVVKENIQYVELPHIPGTRFVFSDIESIAQNKITGYLYIGHQEVVINEVEKYFGGGFYTKDHNGNLVKYDDYIKPFITNKDISNLKNSLKKILVYDYYKDELIAEFNTTNIDTICNMLNLKKEFVKPVLNGYRNHHKGYTFKYKNSNF